MTAVSNTSPILALSRIGELRLLQVTHPHVCVPIAVQLELARHGVLLSRISWIDVVPIIGSPAPDLDAGEAEAIRLALELKADVLCIDERVGRARAVQAGLRVIGTLGIVAEGKRLGHIEACAPLLKRLREQDFWVDERFAQRFLRAVGEAS